MGNLGLKLKGTRALTDQMQLKCNEDEKYWMADACEEIGKRCKSMAFGHLHRTACIKASGLELFLEIISLWEKDEIMIRPAFRALLQIVPEEGACEHLLEMGGRDVIDRAMNNHKEDPQIKGDGTKIMYALLGKGALVAMRDVTRVNKAIEYSVPLSVAETIQIDNGKRKQKRFNQAEEDLDHDLEKGQKAGILRVVTSMKKFSHDTSVQVGGIETMMVLARKGLNPRDIVAAGGVEALVAAMTSYPKSYQIQWRGCATITDFCDSLAICSELGKRGAVAVVMNAYERFTDQKDVRQQALWAMAGLSKIDHCKERMEELQLKILLYKLILIPIKSPGTVIDVVVPLRFHQIYTHEDLDLAANPPKKSMYDLKAEKKAALDKKGKSKPAFGTVDDFFMGGEVGLVDW
ncbi:hypothetical protein TrLO_g11503 [Triparma laevis f. longispina]|uniref:Uncharacterized protein n=1 Tax=Triparma laevis f. longispina TaxID=1714387 RepID=A0A9W7CAK3_9STRA|nr:hypothetical protein TrLO_g11503 [Triparma laevis f. longispina]